MLNRPSGDRETVEILPWSSGMTNRPSSLAGELA
jgi:hypothetical protein